MADQKSAGVEPVAEPEKQESVVIVKPGNPDRRFGGENAKKLGKDGCGY